MLRKKSVLFILLSLVMIFSSIACNTLTAAAASSDLTLDDMPQSFKASIEWVYTNRMVKEGTPSYKNLIFDQIYAGKGTLNYVVRWQSSKSLTLEQRNKITAMIRRQVTNWTQYLKGYDGWPYDDIAVNVVGWACADASRILDKQPGETVYTDYIVDDLSKTDSRIPEKLPCAPDALSRFLHYSNPNYTYPGGLEKRFDMYLWGTTNFNGGAGGDWGQRISDDYILSILDVNEAHIIEHEIGHGFGFPDFYSEADRPVGGFPVPTIMWAGNSSTITSWDCWLLRYTWSQLKKDISRFPAAEPPEISYGDLNDDGTINSTDFALLKKYLLTGEAGDVNLQAADVNADGAVNTIDLALLKSYLLGNISGF